MNFTEEQQCALDARGRVLVSAAAGSGKTAVLVEKVVRMISDENNPIDIDKLLVVTFTNAAAIEMKSRISKRITDLIKDNPENFNLRRQKLLLPSASVCTIDSLCISLAKEYFYKLGLPPDFKIADKSEILKLKNKCIDEIFSECFASQDEDFMNLASCFGTERADEKIKENVFKLHEYLCTLPFPDEYIEKVKKIYDEFDENSLIFNVVFEYAAEIVKNSINIFMPCYDELKNEPDLYKNYGEAFAEIDTKLKRALKFIDNRDYDGLYEMLERYSSARLKGVRNYSDEAFKNKMKNAKISAENTFKELKKIFNVKLCDVYDDIKTLNPIINKFLDLTVDFSNRLYEEKLSNNCFGFSDIEIEVLKLLVKKENGEIVYSSEAKELSKKYVSVLVDEYQDTNDLQNTIFNALSDDGKNLFMVGDVKQSIYGFRKANPKNFLKSRNELKPYKEGSLRSKVIMSGNFRSSSGVCDFVNFLFYRLLTEECGEMFYNEEDMLVPKAEFDNVANPRVQLDIISESESEYTSAQQQAYHIADKIKQEVLSKPIITCEDGLRKAQYGDICVLLRSRAEIPTFVEVFKKAGIPVWADDNEGLLQEDEVINLFSVLQVIDNPYNDVALLTLMLSDIYNFSADEIALMRAECKNTELYCAVLNYSKHDLKTAEFLEEIEEFRSVAAMSSVSKLINLILNKTGYFNTVYLYENGQTSYNNLLIFKDIARSFEESTNRGLSAFVGYIKHLIKSGSNLQKAGTASENDNVVRIMTMHRSKGLQFPVCILACLNKPFNKTDNTADILMSESIGVGMNYFDEKRRIKYSTFPKNAAVIENNASLVSEEMRLLYVAMTRAKDFLLMIGTLKNPQKTICDIAETVSVDEFGRFNPYFVMKCDCFLKMLIAGVLYHKNGQEFREMTDKSFSLGGNEEIRVAIVDKINCDIIPQPEEKNFYEADEDKYAELCEVLNYTYPYRDLNKIFVKQSASALAHKEFSSDYDFTCEPLFIGNQKLSAAQKGTAVHKFLQFCVFNQAHKSIASEIERLKALGKLTKEEADSIKTENLQAFFDSEIGQAVCNSEKVYREQNFMIEVDAHEIYKDLGDEFDGEKIIIQGVADLCFETDGGLYIIDYKTDMANEEELIKRYKIQLDIYDIALSQTFNMPVCGKAIYSFFNKKLIEL